MDTDSAEAIALLYLKRWLLWGFLLDPQKERARDAHIFDMPARTLTTVPANVQSKLPPGFITKEELDALI